MRNRVAGKRSGENLSVVYLQIEKAHPDVFNICFRFGRRPAADNKGRTVDFEHHHHHDPNIGS